ncbi:MAG: hypothetical protein AAF394_09930 [Planctomycetota bacterium]
MRLNFANNAMISLAFACTCLLQFAAGQELTAEKCDTLLAELQPKSDALWRTIPWKTSLLEAQKAAAKENKPIFIWAMDGHPLGCT